MIYFKSNLKYILKRLHVSQEELASYVKVRSTTISNYVNGISSPAIEELVKICQYFGVSIDFFLFQNFEDGKVITDQDVLNFKEKGKVIGKPIGKVMGQNLPFSDVQNKTSILNDPQEENMLWAVLQTLRQMDTKLDGVRDSVDSIASKKA